MRRMVGFALFKSEEDLSCRGILRWCCAGLRLRSWMISGLSSAALAPKKADILMSVMVGRERDRERGGGQRGIKDRQEASTRTIKKRA